MLTKEQAAQVFTAVTEVGFDATVECDRENWSIAQERTQRTVSVYTVTALYPRGGQFDLDELAQLRSIANVSGAGPDGFGVGPIEAR